MTLSENVHDSGLEEQAESQEYLRLCQEASVGSRLIGLLDQARIEEALNDPLTVQIETPIGKLPLIVPIKYADAAGYDVARCSKILGRDQGIWYYSMPSGEGGIDFDQAVKEGLSKAEDGYLFYDVNKRDPMLDQEISTMFSKAGFTTQEVPLLDSKAKEDNQQVSIVLYAAHATPGTESHTSPGAGIDGLYEAYRKGVSEGKYVGPQERNGTIILRGDEIDTSLAEKLWELYKERFQWLGEMHPISMEDTQKSFSSLLLNANTLAAVHMKEGEPLCLAYFVGDIDSAEWLNKKYLSDHQKMGMAEEEALLFFPGIVAKANGIASYSKYAIQLITNLVADTGSAYCIAFENTNRSEVYLPNLLQNFVDEVGKTVLSQPQPIDRTTYRCLKFFRTVADE